ncbi:MAG: hypothetical protein J1E16_09650 [Muribaculaceae bacterium]|nr:hypothetical protein [Muribaculaceae bacterium]
MDKNKDFLYGIGSVKFDDFTIGYIEKGSFDFGGVKPESVDVDAEQVPDAPVLTLLQKNGQISPTFNLIQLNYKNIHAVLGGTLLGGEENPKGWSAPSNLMQKSGKWVINLVSGQTIIIPNGTILANPAGKLTLTEVAKIECQLKVNKPTDGSSPYSIVDSEDVLNTVSNVQTSQPVATVAEANVAPEEESKSVTTSKVTSKSANG